MDYSSTLAGELAARLSQQIDLVAASSLSSSSSNPESKSDGGDNDDVDGDSEGEEAKQDTLEDNDSTSTTSEDAAAASLESSPCMLSLQASLARLRSNPMPSSYSKLQDSIDQAWKAEMELHHAQTIVSAASSSSSKELPESIADNLVWTVNAHLTASSYCAVLENLLNQAEKVKQEELYWESVESRDRHSAMYLVQSKSVQAATKTYIGIAYTFHP